MLSNMSSLVKCGICVGFVIFWTVLSIKIHSTNSLQYGEFKMKNDYADDDDISETANLSSDLKGDEILNAIKTEFLCFDTNNTSVEDGDENTCTDLCCDNIKEILNVNEEFLFTEPKLLCRSDVLLTIGWITNDNITDVVYLAELKSGNTLTINTTKDRYITFKDLKSNSAYSVCISAFNLYGQIGKRKCNQFRTLEINYTLNTISNFNVTQYYDYDNGLEGEIYWEPAEDQHCFYVLTILKNVKDGPQEFPLEVPINMFKYVIPLEYNSNYRICINSMKEREESERTCSEFKTLTCMEVHNSIITCPPPTPTGMKVSDSVSNEYPLDSMDQFRYYDVKIEWNKPNITPEYYKISLSDGNRILTTDNVLGNQSEKVFKGIPISGFYKIELYAGSLGGLSEPLFEYRELELQVEKNDLLWVIVTPILLFIVFVCCAAIVYRRHKKSKLYRRRCCYIEDLEQKASKEIDSSLNFTLRPSDDAFEILASKLELFEILGEGAFGIVRKGWLPDQNKEVAVKMLKDNPSVEEVKQFRQEINMMKSVGSHAHIVSLIGCCTHTLTSMKLIVEYCPRGDLQNYLRDAWDKISSKYSSQFSKSITLDSNGEEILNEPMKYAELVSPDNSEGNSQENPSKQNCIMNKLYDIQTANEFTVHKDSEITAVDLLSFARQIAIGMEYLSSNKVVHRDLAARNVLVCSDKTVKISDFGLSRDIYQDNMYKKLSSGKLPVKWMALESLTHQVYTTQSDVWSYGILLWEIVTLGGTPYPSIPSGRLLKLLSSGYRMERPSNCSTELYNVMMSCWKIRPKDRPNFTDVKQEIDTLLEGICSNAYLSLDVMDYKNVKDTRRYQLTRNIINNSRSSVDKNESERYVRPITLAKNNLSSNIHTNNQAVLQTDANNSNMNLLLKNQITYPFHHKFNNNKKIYNKCSNDDKHDIDYTVKKKQNHYATQNLVNSEGIC